MKNCIACGMPMQEPSEFALSDTSKDYCVHCARPDGTLQSLEEKLKSMTAVPKGWTCRRPICRQKPDGAASGLAESTTGRVGMGMEPVSKFQKRHTYRKNNIFTVQTLKAYR